MTELSKKIAEMEYDGLFADLIPHKQVSGGKIRKLADETTLKRGTILAKSSTDNKLVVLGTAAQGGETLTPDCILCDDVVVGTAEDVVVEVYTAGCFNANKVTVASGYTITEGDRDDLRTRDIVLKAVSPAI